MARGKSVSLALRVQPSAVFGQWSPRTKLQLVKQQPDAANQLRIEMVTAIA
jgi:hypothetical protein